jgi:hypothetical protein
MRHIVAPLADRQWPLHQWTMTHRPSGEAISGNIPRRLSLLRRIALTGIGLVLLSPVECN